MTELAPRETDHEYEAKIDSLGDLASQFVFSAIRHPEPFLPEPFPWACWDVYRKFPLDRFVISILRHMKLPDGVLFGALMFIQRLRFRACKPVFKKHHAHKTFISAYILSAKEFAREDGFVSPSLEDYNEWSVAAQGLFDGTEIKKMERTTLNVLQEDRKKGLQADTTFDGLLTRFSDIVIEDYEVKWQFPTYPQSLATIRPVFMIHGLLDDED